MTYPPPYEQQPGAHPTQPVPSQPSSSPPTSPYPTYLGPPAPPRRSNAPILAVVITLAVLLAGGTVTMCLLLGRTPDPGTTATDNTRDPATPQAQETTPEAEPTTTDDYGSGNSGDGAKVVYEVTGSGSATVIFFKADGVTPEQVGEVDLPWRKELALEGDAAFVSVNATRASGEGALGCRITIDGKEVAKKSTSGQYAIVLCTKLVL